MLMTDARTMGRKAWVMQPLRLAGQVAQLGKLLIGADRNKERAIGTGEDMARRELRLTARRRLRSDRMGTAASLAVSEHVGHRSRPQAGAKP